MIELKCTAPDTVKLTHLVPFQGDLKKRSDADIEALAASLKTEGMLMPFAIWQSPASEANPTSEIKILDGHGRYAALIKAALTDPSILEQEFPAITIKAADEIEARKALVQIVSTYGKIYKAGVIQFASTISGYKAPVLQKAYTATTAKATTIKPAADTVIVRLSVPREKVKQLTELLKSVNGVTVL